MRLIDADKLEYWEIDEVGGEYSPYMGCSRGYINKQPTIQAIPIEVLDKIRAEIIQERDGDMGGDESMIDSFKYGCNMALDIIDKYREVNE